MTRRALAAAAALVPLALPAAALAAGGTLSLSTSGNPAASLTLDGVDRTTAYALPLTVADTGTMQGWNLTITSTTFTSGARSLPTAASTIDAAPGVACSGGNGCTDPVNAVGFPVAVPAAATAPAPSKFFDAASGSGGGTFTITPTVTVAVPANAYSGAYTSTVSLAIVSGP